MKCIFIFIFLYLFSPQQLEAIIIGSNTVPSREAFTPFPLHDTDNEMRGFGWFYDGFSLANKTTTCTFNSSFPVIGTMLLNGGSLYLRKDFTFLGTSNVIWGSVFGNNHFFELGSTFTSLSAGTAERVGGITLIDSLTLGEESRSVDWRSGDAHLAAGLKNGVVDELEGFSFDGTSISSVDTAAVGEDINSLRWHPMADRLATVQKQTAVPELRIWSFNPVSETFTQVDSAESADDLQAVAWRPQGDHIAVGGRLPNVDVYPVDGSGNLGTIINADTNPSDRPNRNAIEWDDSGNYFAVGVRQSAGAELLIYYFDGTNLTFTVGADLGDDVTSVSWSPTGTFIAVGIKNGVTETLRIYEHHVWDGTLTENTAARVGETLDINTVDWSSAGKYLAAGRIVSSGSEIFIYEFDKSAVTLTELSSANLGDDVNDIRWSHDDAYVAVVLKNQNIEIYSIEFSSFTTIDSALFDNLYFIFNEELDLGLTLTLRGNCTIEGMGHRLDLGSVGEIVCDGTLTLRNLFLSSLGGTRLRCVHDTDSIILHDVKVGLTDSYSFTMGSFIFQNDVKITGIQVFAYESSSSSTIDSHSTLFFDRETTFSYDPPVASQNLFVMTDSTSRLHLQESDFFVSSTGLKLTNGMIIIEDKVKVISDASVETEGLIWGDGISSDNDIRVVFLPESNLQLESGFLMYNNVL